MTTSDEAGETAAALAALALARLRDSGRTIAVAESLTGGLLAATLVSVPGASVSFRGAIVTYATDVKASLLGVPEQLLAERGPVDAETAAAMAAGVRDRLAADIGVATTGVAGPDPQDGKAVGTVFIAVCDGAARRVEQHALSGSRAQIRAATVAAALGQLVDALGR